MLESHLHKLILLNAGCCVLYLVGKMLQELLLGPLREMEAMKVRACSPALVERRVCGGARAHRAPHAHCAPSRRWEIVSAAMRWSRWCS